MLLPSSPRCTVFCTVKPMRISSVSLTKNPHLRRETLPKRLPKDGKLHTKDYTKERRFHTKETGCHCSIHSRCFIRRSLLKKRRNSGTRRFKAGGTQVPIGAAPEERILAPHRRSQNRPLESPNKEIVPSPACLFSWQLSPAFIHQGVLSYPVPFFDDNSRASPE